MKLFEVIFTDESREDEIDVPFLVVSKEENDAVEKAWNKYYEARGKMNKPLKEMHSLFSVHELDEVDEYRININSVPSNEYENLIETSNANHNAFYDYLEQHGMDEKLEVFLVGKHRWLEWIAKKYNLDL